MVKTTVYLPDDLKRAVENEARRSGASEAEVIREAIRASVGAATPAPRPGILETDTPIADRLDDFLTGFGT